MSQVEFILTLALFASMAIVVLWLIDKYDKSDQKEKVIK